MTVDRSPPRAKKARGLAISFGRRDFLAGVAGASVALSAPRLSFAQAAWPTKPVRIVVTFAPGGASDIVARLLGQYMSDKIGQQVLVDNRPGAGGTLAADIVKKEAADGHTLILSNNAPFTIAPTQFKTVPYDTLKDFTHISYVGASSPGLFVHPSLGIKTAKEFVERAKAKPAELKYGSSGAGSIHHIAGESLKATAGINIVHVPYRGSAPAIQDFKAGVLPSFFDFIPQNAPMLEAKEAICLGVASDTRISQAPDVPTFKEQGLNVVLEGWMGISGPAAMPPAVVTAVHNAIRNALALPEVQERMNTWGFERRAMSPTEFTKYIADSIETWRPLIIEAGVQEK
jgi:tripartite-type tricarboxylate transporter receptor subunit TctC